MGLRQGRSQEWCRHPPTDAGNGFQQNQDGSWRVITEQGEIHTEHVVNAGGLWAREVGRMVGLELPVLAMEHMYLLTEDMPEVVAFNESSGLEVPHCVDFDGELYLRQERKGMLMGTYEKACKPWSPKRRRGVSDRAIARRYRPDCPS
ncbi:MAG: hypothetical protein CM1200mP18_17400 [Gammaproteobacteria bacterium]|nr:MAG: hypothetical protein CM1200mP18_17400 [Gammaproteobacteria bacterium]